MNPLYANRPTTIFEEMSALARARGAINLGQGFPDEDGPADIRQAAADALLHQSNQYPPMLGLPVLRAAVADHYRAHHGPDATADEVLVTSGATEALAAAILALVRPGDEVVLIQPMYDAYLPLVREAGGIPRFVTLRPPEWRLTADALAAACSPATRMIVLNDPMNPTGKLFDDAERALIADACTRHDAIALCDEVWEHVLFDGARHCPLIAWPGMRDRTVKVGSAGKIFALTGWKVGWIVAAPRLLEVIAKAHQYLAFTTPPALQIGAAYGLGKDSGYFAAMRAGFQRSRDRLASGLRGLGLSVLDPQATWFLCVDLAASGITEDDRTFCLRITDQAGVAAIPLSAFYAEDPVRSVVRFCFTKQDGVLDEALDRLRLHLRSP